MIWENDISLWRNTCNCSSYSAIPFVNLGKAYLDIGDLNDAENALNKSLVLSSHKLQSDIRYGTDFRAYNNLSIIYAKKGDFNKALFFINKAIDINHSYNAYMNQGIYFLKLNSSTEALSSFKSASMLRSNDIASRAFIIKILLFQHDCLNAQSMVKSLSDLDADSKTLEALNRHFTSVCHEK